MWFETEKKELVLGQMFCLEATDRKPILGKCHEMGGDQEWQHKGTVNIFLSFFPYLKEIQIY